MIGNAKEHEPRSVRFRKEREAQWKELEAMVDKVLRKGPACLNSKQLEKLPKLYRATLSSLSVARITAMDRALVDYLENLSARAWLAVYGSREPARRVLKTFVAKTFPKQVRKLAVPLGMASFAFFLGIVVSLTLVLVEPEWFYAFVPHEYAAGRDPWTPAEELKSGLYESSEGLSEFSVFLFSNNTGVGILSFGLGIAAAVPTAILLFTNGLILGAFLALFSSKGLLIAFMGWLLPHGIPEIFALLLCGAAGMALGRAMVFPGSLSRRDALSRAGRKASLVVAGSVLLFAYAGIVEGVFRQLVTHDGIRYGVALLNLIWIGYWIFFTGRFSSRIRGRRGGSAE